MIHAIIEYQFMQKALLACFFASIVCGVIGVIIIEKKLVMMCGGIAHSSYGGVGLGYLLGFEPLLGAFAFSLAAACGIGYAKRRGGEGGRSDVFNGLFWSLGMSLGILFIALMPGYPPDVGSYLFGSILSVTYFDLILTVILAAVVVLVAVMLFDYWRAYLFDEEFAAILGLPCGFLEYLLLIMIAMATVVLIRVVGIILILALLLAPAASASLLCRSLKGRMLLAIALGWVYCLAGLWISYEADIASGALIAIVSVGCYLAIAAVRRIFVRFKVKC